MNCDVNTLATSFAALLGMCTHPGGAGVALDWATSKPVPGAKISFQCWGDSRSGLEGHQYLRTVTRTTDLEGRYSFSSSDLSGCTLVMFSGQKDGYSGAVPGDIINPFAIKIPAEEYLIKTEDRVWYQLKIITPNPQAHTMTNGVQNVSMDYQHWLTAFFEAKRIASTPREIEFVREHYCPNLATLFSGLSEAEETKIARQIVTFQFDAQSGRGALGRYETEVAPYCEAP
jgi:hypothetical protein